MVKGLQYTNKIHLSSREVPVLVMCKFDSSQQLQQEKDRPKAPCIYCGRHHSLDQCRGVRNLIDEHKRLQLARRGGISKPSPHRGSSWRTNKPSQFSARAYNGGGNGAADRGGRSGGGNGAAYRGRHGGGRNGAAGGNGHHGRRGSFPGRSNRVRFTSHPAPRPHTNNVFVPEQGDDAAVRQIVQANSASPHFVGAAITSAKGKDSMESPPTVSRKQLAAESDSDLIILTSSDDDNEHAKEEEYSDNDCGIFGPDSSSSDNDSTKHDDDDDIDSSDHDDQEEEEAQAANDQEETQAANDQEAQAANDQEEAQAAEAEWRQIKYRQQMRQEDQQTYDKTMKQTRGLFDFTQKTFITLPQYEEGTKFQFDISPAKLCDYLYNNTVSAEQVYTVLANTHNDYLVQLQATMKERFNRDFEPKHQPQMITYANFINNQVHKRTGSTTFWITLVPWSKLAWLWGDNLAAPPDPPDPPDIPEVSLDDEAHAAFAATLSSERKL